jgi:hypothetical protein
MAPSCVLNRVRVADMLCRKRSVQLTVPGFCVPASLLLFRKLNILSGVPFAPDNTSRAHFILFATFRTC